MLELVYLWVKKYKNIHEQGFNFSPQFDCSYKDDVLTIADKEETGESYIKNFFGKDINVTAIVGKNGSGKSSISEILGIFSYQEFLDEKSFLVYLIGDKFLCKQSYTKKKFSFEIVNNTKYSFPKLNVSRRVSALYFGNETSSIFNNPKQRNIENYAGNINAYYSANTYLMPNNTYQYNNKYKDNEIEIFNKRFVNILKKYKNILSKINDKIMFDMYRNELHLYEIGAHIAGNNDFLDLLNKDELNGSTLFDSSEKGDSHLYKLLILFRLLDIKDTEKKEIINKIKGIYRKDNLSKKEMMSIHNNINKYDKKSSIFSEDNIENIVSSFEYLKDEIWVENEGHNISEKNILKNDLLKILYSSMNRVNFYNSEKKDFDFYSLSSGEREYIKIFVAYIYHLDLLMKNTDSVNEKRIFIFDEPDLGLHPNWQKQLFCDLIYVTKEIVHKKINILVTTHSPFLLSDIPKQNIIFLDRYKKDDYEVKENKQDIGNCKVVVGLEEKKQTFGANIHTLLSDSFFMEDGLIGEFAKGMINDVYNFIVNYKTDKIKTKKEAQDIINIIGEPLIKKELQQLFDEKFELSKMSLDDEISLLKAKLKALKEIKNDTN